MWQTDLKNEFEIVSLYLIQKVSKMFDENMNKCKICSVIINLKMFLKFTREENIETLAEKTW